MGDLPRAGIRGAMSPFVLYWPMVLWALGFIEFHLTVFFGPRNGHTLGVSLWIAIAVLLAALWRSRNATLRVAGVLAGEVRRAPVLFWMLCAVQAGMFVLAGYEAHFPPHWPQEGDAINYHMALPRQHLFWGSLEHLPWSVADLWPMALQFGFASVWFMSSTINKWPQLFGALWAFGLMLALGRPKAGHSFSGWIPALALFTTHGVMVQLGMAMLDLANLYLLLAAWHAAVHRRPFWWAVHVALYAATKAFHPAQASILVIAIVGYMTIFERGALVANRRLMAKGALLSTAIFAVFMTRSVSVSIERAGTPLHPFAVCKVIAVVKCEGRSGEAVRLSASTQIASAYSYGNGRHLGAFFRHLWRVAVPAVGMVNNEYDYPLGLTWLLVLVFFAMSVPEWIRFKKVSPELVIAAVVWFLWWYSSQQSRWLYPLMAFGLLASVKTQIRASQTVVVAVVLVAAFMSLVSELRALGPDLNVRAPDLQAQMEVQIELGALPNSVKQKQTLYAGYAVIFVDSIDPNFILPQYPADY